MKGEYEVPLKANVKRHEGSLSAAAETPIKAPLCKGSWREATEGLFVKESSVRYNPSVTASRATSLCTREASKVWLQVNVGGKTPSVIESPRDKPSPEG